MFRYQITVIMLIAIVAPLRGAEGGANLVPTSEEDARNERVRSLSKLPKEKLIEMYLALEKENNYRARTNKILVTNLKKTVTILESEVKLLQEKAGK